MLPVVHSGTLDTRELMCNTRRVRLYLHTRYGLRQMCLYRMQLLASFELPRAFWAGAFGYLCTNDDNNNNLSWSPPHVCVALLVIIFFLSPSFIILYTEMMVFKHV